MTAIQKLSYAVTYYKDCHHTLWSADPRQFEDYHPGVDLYAENAYSCSGGTVVAIGSDGMTYSVTVQQDANTLFRYCNLRMILVNTGYELQAGSLIGHADDYVHFEYCTREQGASIWCVRVGTEQYYKQNPLTVFED